LINKMFRCVREMPLDDMPLVKGVSRAAILLRAAASAATGPFIWFRVESHPGLIVIWQTSGFDALIYTMFGGEITGISLILIGAREEKLTLDLAVDLLGLDLSTLNQISDCDRPIIASFTTGKLSATGQEQLGKRLFLPALLKRHGITIDR
jgi:hypothetical protein